MQLSPARPAQITGVTLVAIAVSQGLFLALSGSLEFFQAQVYWTVEAALYLAMAVAALLLAIRSPSVQLAASAVVVGALCNVVQLVIGIAMFAPLADAGPEYRPVYDAVHASAFAFYFAGRAMFGLAAIGLGLLFVWGTGSTRLVGAALAVAGLAAVAVNAVALATGETLILQAGATGTIAALGVGLALSAALRRTAPANPA